MVVISFNIIKFAFFDYKLKVIHDQLYEILL